MVSKIHPGIQEFSAETASKELLTVQKLREFYESQKVVATTCLTIKHPIFSKMKFDYCIVDEATQLTLPTCLGPLQFAHTFVLVGDPYQLPPLVSRIFFSRMEVFFKSLIRFETFKLEMTD
jgi:DNA replication ATP-dependent helicase Dna2